MTNFFTKGIDWSDPNLTRDIHIWTQYLCWCIRAWMTSHIPYYPRWLRRRLLKCFPARRHGISWRDVCFSKTNVPGYICTKRNRPLPWYIGVRARGPLVRPWLWTANRFLQHRGGCSHRCEFTDKEWGALYGGQRGAFMDTLFEKFLENISDPAENAKWN